MSSLKWGLLFFLIDICYIGLRGVLSLNQNPHILSLGDFLKFFPKTFKLLLPKFLPPNLVYSNFLREILRPTLFREFARRMIARFTAFLSAGQMSVTSSQKPFPVLLVFEFTSINESSTPPKLKIEGLFLLP